MACLLSPREILELERGGRGEEDQVDAHDDADAKAAKSETDVLPKGYLFGETPRLSVPAPPPGRARTRNNRGGSDTARTPILF